MTKKPHSKKQGPEVEVTPEQAMDEGLAAIYGEQRDDLGKLDQAGSRVTRWLVTIVLSLLTATVLAVIGFVIYLNFFAVAKVDPLTMEIELPSEIASGTVTTVTVHYKNNGRVPLANLSIDVNVPAGFVPNSMTPMPTDAEKEIFDLGSVQAGAEGAVMLTGVWLTTVPSINTVQALATYRPANFNADFTAVASTTASSNTSSLLLTMTGPDKTSPGESVVYTLILENTSEVAAANVTTEVALPVGFMLTASDPAFIPAGPTTWTLVDLVAHDKKTMTMTGSWSADMSDVVQMVGKVSTKLNDVTMVQGQTSVFTNIIGNGLRLSLVANGATSNVSIDPGSQLRVTVGYENTGEEPLTGVSLVVDFQAAVGQKVPITWKEASLDNGKLTQEGIVFDAKTVGTLPTHESKTRNLIFPVKTTVAVGEAQNWTVAVHATVNGVTISSQPLTITLNSDTHFTAAARYFTADGAPLGTGPLPPKVGQTTQYSLLWSVNNTLHALSEVRVSATLPPGATWGNATTASAGTVSYDAASRVVSWTVASAEASNTALTASFIVSVTPGASDAGTFVKLLSGSAFRATDGVTASSLQQTGDILTTECTGDAGVTGKGYVSE